MDTEPISKARAEESLARISPIIHPDLVQCISNSLSNAIDGNGNFDDEKFQKLVKDCVANVYTGVDRVTVGKLAALVQALFFAML